MTDLVTPRLAIIPGATTFYAAVSQHRLAVTKVSLRKDARDSLGRMLVRLQRHLAKDGITQSVAFATRTENQTYFKSSKQAVAWGDFHGFIHYLAELSGGPEPEAQARSKLKAEMLGSPKASAAAAVKAVKGRLPTGESLLAGAADEKLALAVLMMEQWYAEEGVDLYKEFC